MAKAKKKELTTANDNVPAYLKEYSDNVEGVDQLSEFVRPPRIKMIQKSASDELLDKFSVGDCVIMPQEILVCSKGESITFTPIYFFPEWIIRNPWALKDLPMIHDRSRDPQSEIAKRARNRDTWFEDIEGTSNDKNGGKPHQRQYVEVLNFIGMIHGVEGLENTPVLFSNSKGAWKHGSNLASMVKMRGQSIYACNFKLTSKAFEGSGNTYYAMEPSNPEETPFVETEEEFLRNKEFHALFSETQIEAEYDDPDKEAAEADGSTTEF